MPNTSTRDKNVIPGQNRLRMPKMTAASPRSAIVHQRQVVWDFSVVTIASSNAATSDLIPCRARTSPLRIDVQVHRTRARDTLPVRDTLDHLGRLTQPTLRRNVDCTTRPGGIMERSDQKIQRKVGH